MKTIVSLLLLLPAFSVFAYTSNSLTWQKLALEEKVQRKYNITLSSLLKENQYLVEVETEMNEPPAPNFGDSGPKTGPRVSEMNLADSRGDYIAFSKMGLEVPVVDKFLDEDRTKLMNLYRFNETYDLFKNLSGVNVTVFLSDKITPELIEIVKKVVNSSKFSVSGIKPMVKYESMQMEWIDPALAKLDDLKKKEKKAEKKIQEEPKIWAKDWLEWASRWGNAVGLILGALIIGFIALSLFKQWKAFMEKIAALEAQKKNEDEKEDKDGNEMAIAMAAETPKEEEDMAVTQGFDRFQQCLNDHPEDAITMVRSWLNESEENDILALRGIAQQATAEQMEKLMNGLSETQRDQWKSHLGKFLETPELNAANKQLFQAVVKAFLVPSRIKDGELLNLIMELNAKTTCEFFNAHKDQVGILMNLLSPSVIGKILAEVDDEKADKWLGQGSDFKENELEEGIVTLKEDLNAFKKAHGPSPFAHRIMSMIPTAQPSRESTLYRALAKAGNSGMVLEVAKKYFPSELILELPSPFLKEVMQSYPVNKRVALLHSRPEDVRTTLINILAESGTPARDMLDMELENLSRDPSKGAAIESQSEEIWQEFVKLSRASLSSATSYSGFADQIVREWSQKLKVSLQSIKGGKAA